MLKIILDSIKPSTRVGVSSFKAHIEKANLAKYGTEEEKKLDNIYARYNTILEYNANCEDFVCHLLQALLSGSNQVFQNFIHHEGDEWDVGKDTSAEDLMAKAKEKLDQTFFSHFIQVLISK